MQASADENRSTLITFHIWVCIPGEFLYGVKLVLEGIAACSKHDHDAARIVARSPDEVVLVSADGLRHIRPVSSSGLLLLALRHLEREDLGFELDRRLVINVDPLLAGYKPEQLDSLYRRIHESLAALPGTESVASALYTPQSGDEWDETVFIAGKPAPSPGADSAAGWTRVSP